MTKQEEIRGDIFLVLQDVRLGELTEYEATLKLQELGVVIKVDIGGGYSDIEPLIKEGKGIPSPPCHRW